MRFGRNDRERSSRGAIEGSQADEDKPFSMDSILNANDPGLTLTSLFRATFAVGLKPEIVFKTR
jgi:hypothetical protein